MNKYRVLHLVLGAAVAAWAGLAPCALFAQSQNDPSQNPQVPQDMSGTPSGSATPSMRDSLGSPGMTGQDLADKKFVHDAAEGGIAEVKLGELAAQKGSAGVKEFGQKMVEDHSAMNKDMATVADSLGVMLPKKMSKDEQADYDRLSALSGAEFDTQYILLMVKNHRQDLHDFRVELAGTNDPAVQAEIAKASAVIRDHLTLLTNLAKDKNVAIPARPVRPTPPPAGQ